MGAQRVKANFEDLEREAQIADEQKVRAEEESKKVVEVKAEEQENQVRMPQGSHAHEELVTYFVRAWLTSTCYSWRP